MCFHSGNNPYLLLTHLIFHTPLHFIKLLTILPHCIRTVICLSCHLHRIFFLKKTSLTISVSAFAPSGEQLNPSIASCWNCRSSVLKDSLSYRSFSCFLFIFQYLCFDYIYQPMLKYWPFGTILFRGGEVGAYKRNLYII